MSYTSNSKITFDKTLNIAELMKFLYKNKFSTSKTTEDEAYLFSHIALQQGYKTLASIPLEAFLFIQEDAEEANEY